MIFCKNQVREAGGRGANGKDDTDSTFQGKK